MRDEILIGEGVVIDARPASFATRLVGAGLDAVVYALVLLILTVVVGALGIRLDPAAAQALIIVALIVLMVGVPVTVETLSRGRSLGKLVMGIRIVRDDGGPGRFRHALIRALVGVLELWFTFGAVALIASIAHPKGKRLGDMVAGTYALRVRGGGRALPPVVMPADLAGWVRHADIRRLPDGLALNARQFLGRAPRLHPASRADLGASLAAEIEQYVAPGPPVGTHPERFIAAVLAERRDREYAHAARSAAAAATEAALVHRLPHAVPDPD